MGYLTVRQTLLQNVTFAMNHSSLKLCTKTEFGTIKYSGAEQGPPLPPLDPLFHGNFKSIITNKNGSAPKILNVMDKKVPLLSHIRTAKCFIYSQVLPEHFLFPQHSIVLFVEIEITKNSLGY